MAAQPEHSRSPRLIRIVLHPLKLNQGIQLKAAADKVKGVANIPTLISTPPLNIIALTLDKNLHNVSCLAAS